jgi:hypothetical protein
MHSLERVYAEPESEVQGEQDLEYGGPQASCCEEANIPFSWARQAPVHPTNIPWILFLIVIFILSLIVH